MAHHVLPSMIIAGFLLCGSGAWLVKMPSHIKGLRKSCLVIPCSYNYHHNPPKQPDRVVWYQYAQYSYPLVCDDRNSQEVIPQFYRKTSVVRQTSTDCSLQINPVDSSHHVMTIYPWVDPENVGKSTYRFYDTTVTIEVVDTAALPVIKIYGVMKVGKTVTVQCSVDHTCPTYPPTLKINSQRPRVSHASLSDGTSRTTVTTSLLIDNVNQKVVCSVSHYGGLKATASKSLRVDWSILSRDWSYVTPDSITGLTGSCAVIPCSFTYSATQPLDLQVTWYLLQGNAQHQVFPAKQGVNSRYSGRTSSLGSVTHGNCSLLIERLEMSHNQARLYPWVDRNPITSYHGHKLYDKTSQLIVTDSAPQPRVTMNGVPRVGEEMKVFCSVQHSCPTAPPALTLNQLPGVDRLSQAEVSYGVWERTVERTWKVREEDEKVSCTVRHPGGQTATTDLRMAECLFDLLQVSDPGVLAEGVAKLVTCSISYTCKKARPSIEWNFKDMLSSTATLKTSANKYTTISNLTFVPSLDDDGELLTCTAYFHPVGHSSNSVQLRVKKYEQLVVALNIIDNMSIPLAADVLPKITALTGSCVVIPCTFQPKGDLMTGLRGIWYNQAGGRVYHRVQSQVLNHFKGRTNLLGNVGHRNCTLEIDDIKSFDNGPFCFRAETKTEKYRFNNSCVFIVLQASPESPLMSAVPDEVDAGSVVNVTCSVKHTCSSHPPVLTWSNHTTTTVIRHTWMGQGVWETTSTVTLVPETGDGTKDLSCTATFWRGKAQITSVQITVKGSLVFHLRSSMPIMTPTVTVAIVVLLAAAVYLRWRCKRQCETASSPPPRPEKRRSVWSRMSRWVQVDSIKGMSSWDHRQSNVYC